MSKKLSILIASVEERNQLMQNMAKILRLQGNSDVEILVNVDKGQRSIGQKRNELLEAAKGDYVAFIDDDDNISPFYVAKTLKAIDANADCCGLEGIIVQRSTGPRKFIHSLRYNDWFEKDDIYYRCPNHLNAVKREIALQVKFPNINHGEDDRYSRGIRQIIKTEEYIEEPIYFYYPF